MLKRARQWFMLGLGIVVSAIFLYIGLRGLQLDKVWDGIKEAEIAWIVPGVLVYFLAVWGRTWLHCRQML